jgi:4-hydroxy-2-oxoheptanedioate aldolase
MALPTHLPANEFKRSLAEGRQQLGLWHSLANPLVAEVTAGSGSDWILLDGEHSPISIETMMTLLQAVESNGCAPVVRPIWNDSLQLKQLLDIGVMNLLVPNVRTATEAARCVEACSYPPRGVRGMASGVVRASRFGRFTDYVQRIDQELCIVVQIETQEGLDNLDDIAAVDGIAGVFFGPADLAADLGLTGRAGHPEVVEKIEHAIRHVRELGKAAGVLSIEEDLVHRYIKAGSVMTAVGLDIHLLARSTEAAIRRYRPQ